MADNLRRVQREGERAQHFLVRMTQAIVGSTILRELFRIADAYENIQNRIANVAGANDKTYRALFDAAQRTRSAVETTVQIYQRVGNAVAQFGYTSRNVMSFVENLNKLVAYSGANATEANAAIIQLSQGLGAGALRGEELNSVFEQIPELMRIIARNMGVTTGQIRAMAKEGKLTADVIMSAVRKSSDEIDASFGRTMPTLGQRVIQLKNAFLDWFGVMGTSSGLFKTVGAGIDYLRENLDEVMQIVKTLGLLLIGATIAKGITLISRAVLGLMTALALNPFGIMIKAIVVLLPLLADLAGGFDKLADKISKWASEEPSAFKWARETIDGSDADTGREARVRASMSQFLGLGVFGNRDTEFGKYYDDPIAYASSMTNYGGDQSDQYTRTDTFTWERDPSKVADAYFAALTDALETNATHHALRGAKIIMDTVAEVDRLRGQHNLDLIDNLSATIGDVTAKAVADQIAAAKEAEKAAKKARQEWEQFVRDFGSLRDRLNPVRGALNEFFADYQMFQKALANADKLGWNPAGAPSGLFKAQDNGRLTEINDELRSLRLTPSEQLAIVVGSGGQEYLVARHKTDAADKLLAERAEILRNPYAVSTGIKSAGAEEWAARTVEYDLALGEVADQRGLFDTGKDFSADLAEVEQWDKELADAWASFDEMVTEGTSQMIDQARQWREEWDRARDPMAGLRDGWVEFSATVSNAAEDMRLAFVNALTGINDAIVSLVVTGEANLKKLVDGVLSDLVRALLHAGESELFGAIGLPGFGDNAGPLKFARGGAAKVDGGGGTDANLVMLRATHGEVVQVHRSEGDYARQSSGGGGDVIIQNNWSPGTMLATMGSRAGRREIRNSNEIDLPTLAPLVRAFGARRK